METRSLYTEMVQPDDEETCARSESELPGKAKEMEQKLTAYTRGAPLIQRPPRCWVGGKWSGHKSVGNAT